MNDQIILPDSPETPLPVMDSDGWPFAVTGHEYAVCEQVVRSEIGSQDAEFVHKCARKLLYMARELLKLGEQKKNTHIPREWESDEFESAPEGLYFAEGFTHGVRKAFWTQEAKPKAAWMGYGRYFGPIPQPPSTPFPEKS